MIAMFLERSSRTCGAATKGRDVAEVVQLVIGVVLEVLKDFLGGDHAGNRRVTRGHAFGHGHEVGLDAVMLVAEPFGAGAAHAAHNFVDVQEDVVLFADLLNTLPVALGRFDNTTTCGYRLKAERAYGFGAFAQDDLFDLVRSGDAKVAARQMLEAQLVLAVFHAVGTRTKSGAKGPYCALRSS